MHIASEAGTGHQAMRCLQKARGKAIVCVCVCVCVCMCVCVCAGAAALTVRHGTARVRWKVGESPGLGPNFISWLKVKRGGARGAGLASSWDPLKSAKLPEMKSMRAERGQQWWLCVGRVGGVGATRPAF
jgi:hypothetical protein